jgi:hypothetical protein
VRPAPETTVVWWRLELVVALVGEACCTMVPPGGRDG